MPGIDPISLAAGATQAGIGLLQGIFGGRKAKKAQKELENLQTPTYDANKSILSYYNNALKRYNVNPYDSTLYKTQQQNIGRGVNQGIQGLQDRRSGLAGIASLIQGQNDALLKAGIAAENEKSQRFQQLAGATNMKAADDLRQFQYNKLAPYEKKYNLLAMKAGQNATTANNGLQNIFRGLSSLGDAYKFNKIYGKDNTGVSPVFAQESYMFPK